MIEDNDPFEDYFEDCCGQVPAEIIAAESEVEKMKHDFLSDLGFGGLQRGFDRVIEVGSTLSQLLGLTETAVVALTYDRRAYGNNEPHGAKYVTLQIYAKIRTNVHSEETKDFLLGTVATGYRHDQLY